MTKYKLLRDLPTVDKGAIFKQDGDNSNYYSCIGKDNETFRFTGKDVMELKDWFEEIKENKRWRAERNEKYWIADDTSGFDFKYDYYSNTDDYRHLIGNYYQTEELAQKALNKQIMFQKLKDYALEVNEGWMPDLKKIGKERFFIYYDVYDEKTISLDDTSAITMNQVYFKTAELADQAIAHFGDDLKILFED